MAQNEEATPLRLHSWKENGEKNSGPRLKVSFSFFVFFKVTFPHREEARKQYMIIDYSDNLIIYTYIYVYIF